MSLTKQLVLLTFICSNINKKLHYLLTALAVWITCALAASATDTYDFTYADLQYVITSSNTAKVVGHEAP